MTEDEHFASDEIRNRYDQVIENVFSITLYCYFRVTALNDHWEHLKDKSQQRKQDLEDSLQAHQYYADANEAESWMKEKEPIVANTDYGHLIALFLNFLNNFSSYRQR